jgi:pSer/pThr/pTyr-binding forkhead associated (FHA) protein
MIAKLIVASGKSAGRSIAIKRNRLLIGRAEECDVRPLSEDVSRRHCEVIVGPAEVWVADLGSRNGTFVNGQRISEKTKVVDGDIVRVGALELKVSCVDPAAKAGTEDDVSRWLVADEKPAGMFDTTQTMPLQPAAESLEPAAAADASVATEDTIGRHGCCEGCESVAVTVGTLLDPELRFGADATGGLSVATAAATSLPDKLRILCPSDCAAALLGAICNG